MKKEKEKNLFNTCPICGEDNYRAPGTEERRQYLLGNHGYLRAVAALKDSGLTPAEGHTEESFCEAVRRGEIDPWRVCHQCLAEENSDKS